MSLLILWTVFYSIAKSESLVANLRGKLEHRFPPTTIGPDDEVAGIVVLGGHTARVREAIRLSQLFPRAKIILSGWDSPDEELLRKQNLASGRIMIESGARSTFENAIGASRISAAKPGERWLLVTSAIHMPRAMGSFSAIGFVVEPWPTFAPYDGRREIRYTVLPVMHEMIGLLAYRVVGRTQSLFPGP